MRAETIFLAFANSDTDSLKNLKEEDEGIYEMLSPLMIKGSILIHRDSKATSDSICHHLAGFKDSIRIFLYSGHAGSEKIFLEDQEANAAGVAHILSQCPRLQLVFLNGCSTKGQVQNLLDQGIPAVMATSADISDPKAKDFSLSFFTALKDQNSIKDAFELAKGMLMTKYAGTEMSMHGELSSWGAEEKNDILWGLYVKGDKKVLDWKLPVAQATTKVNPNFVPNKLLFNSLVSSLTPYSKEFAKIKEDEEFGVKISQGQKFNLLMASLPHIVSGQLAKVLAPAKAGSELTSGFAQLGLKRLQQLVIIYETIMELLAATMLSQFWGLQFSDKSLTVGPENSKAIQEFIHLDEEGRRSYTFGKLIVSIRNILKTNDVPLFLPELNELIDSLDSQPKLKEASRFMEDLKTRTRNARIESDEAASLCVPAEENLSELLKHIGFLAKYMLASVKDISVLKYRHTPKPRYQHHIVKLIKDGASDPYEDFDLKNELLDCKSVLIYSKDDSEKEFLNLSPFIIDQNAYDPEANINKLYFFQNYNESEKIISYKHVYKPSDPLLAINGQAKYNIVQNQFDKFLEFLSNHLS